jgi:MoaA/NifB/PqqE/SkfB family radical SAM enzyme
MDKKLLRLPFMSNIGLIMTYKCQIACPHCIIEAGPNRSEEILLEDALNWISQIEKYRSGHVKMLALTGGEPFYNLYNLKRISEFANVSGLSVSVVTNAFWATTKGEATEILRKVPEITFISFSADSYHQKSIPLENVKNAVAAANDCGLPYYISVATENKNNGEYKQIIDKLKEFVKEDKIVTVITFPVGRALKSLDTTKYATSVEPPDSFCFSAGFPVIFPDGKVTACIGPIITLHNNHPLILGDLNKNSLKEILDGAEVNPILHAIRIWGPRKLISLIKEHGMNEYLPSNYVKDSICITCHYLLSNDKIIDFFADLAKDLKFRRRVAYARAYYLHETEMIDFLALQ